MAREPRPEQERLPLLQSHALSAHTDVARRGGWPTLSTTEHNAPDRGCGCPTLATRAFCAPDAVAERRRGSLWVVGFERDWPPSGISVDVRGIMSCKPCQELLRPGPGDPPPGGSRGARPLRPLWATGRAFCVPDGVARRASARTRLP